MFGLKLPWRRTRERSARFCENRSGQEQTNAAFLEDAEPGVGHQVGQLVLLIRRVIADATGLSPTLLRADDQTTELEQLFGSSSLGEFIMAMPTSLPESMDAPDFFWNLDMAIADQFGARMKLPNGIQGEATERWLSGERFGVWASWLAREIASTVV